MAAFDTSRTTYGSPSAVTRVFSALNTASTRLIEWNDARATRRALSALSARELDDIGLCYSDIETVVASKSRR